MRYDASADETRVWARPPGAVEAPAVTARQVAYRSKDGTEVRMLVVGGAPARPVRGGRGARARRSCTGTAASASASPPVIRPNVLAWAEAGGVYAIAGLRGGSEEGEEWHRAGMLDRGRPSSTTSTPRRRSYRRRLGRRRSTGIVRWSEPGAAGRCRYHPAPRPVRARRCSCACCSTWAPVRAVRPGRDLDHRVRHRRPTPSNWVGRSSYSPYHHVTEGVNYPSVLFTVFENDSRVDPMHARKMCAALQYATSAPAAGRPILLRREADVGHSKPRGEPFGGIVRGRPRLPGRPHRPALP